MPIPNCECAPCGWHAQQLAAIQDIAAAIREGNEAVPVTVAQGVIHYPITGYGTIARNATVDIQLFLNPVDYVIVGIGVSYLGAWPSFGSGPAGDNLAIKFWNYTTNSQIGNTLNLKSTQTSDKHTNEGDAIGPNLALGNIGGIKITFTDDEATTFPGKDFDFVLFVKPIQLNPPSE